VKIPGEGGEAAGVLSGAGAALGDAVKLGRTGDFAAEEAGDCGLIRLAHFSRAASTDDAVPCGLAVGGGAFSADGLVDDGVSMRPARSSSIAAASERETGGSDTGAGADAAAGGVRKKGWPLEPGAPFAVSPPESASRPAGSGIPFGVSAGLPGGASADAGGAGSSAMIFRMEARISSIDASDAPSTLLIAPPHSSNGFFEFAPSGAR
jgi:hypothetical protein